MFEYLVSENRLLTPSVRLLTLVHSKPKNKTLQYKPGQYVAISLHDKLRPTTTRCFSLTSSPTQGEFLQLSIREKGFFTSALKRLKLDDVVTVRGPFGSFVFDARVHAHVTFFAGGIGIAPFVSMLRYATDTQVQNKMHLIYSCRKEEDIPFLHELQRLEKQNPNLRITYLIEDGQIKELLGREVLGGCLDDRTIDQMFIDYSKDTFMLCGPPQYMKVVQALLRRRGVENTRIQTESFSHNSSIYTGKKVNIPLLVYVVTGLFFLVTLGYVFALDFNKVSEKHFLSENILQQEDVPVVPEVPESVQEGVEASLTETFKVEKPIVPTPTPVVPVVVAPTPVVVPPSKPTPVVTPVVVATPTPTPTVIPKKPPKTNVS